MRSKKPRFSRKFHQYRAKIIASSHTPSCFATGFVDAPHTGRRFIHHAGHQPRKHSLVYIRSCDHSLLPPCTNQPCPLPSHHDTTRQNPALPPDHTSVSVCPRRSVTNHGHLSFNASSPRCRGGTTTMQRHNDTTTQRQRPNDRTNGRTN